MFVSISLTVKLALACFWKSDCTTKAAPKWVLGLEDLEGGHRLGWNINIAYPPTHQSILLIRE
jgi:hypothetical protein